MQHRNNKFLLRAFTELILRRGSVFYSQYIEYQNTGFLNMIGGHHLSNINTIIKQCDKYYLGTPSEFTDLVLLFF